MVNLKDKTVLVWDYGNYIEIAVRLSREFGKVYYYCPYVFNGYPTHSPYDIGRNVEGIEKVNEWAEVFTEADLIYFPECYDAAIQVLFRSMGKKVFGSGYGNEMEKDRAAMKELQKELKLPLNDYDVVKGIDELERFLKKHDDRFIKSSFRGDMETWHHQNYKLSKIELDRMRSDMGVFKNQEEYIIETPIESIAEVGYDGFVTRGKFPKESLCGIELKDSLYLGKFINYADLPEQMKIVTDRLSPAFEEFDYRGAYSNEIRIGTDGNGYLIDQTCRNPQPNTSLALEMYDNYGEIVWNIADGIVPEIKYSYTWGVQAIIKSEAGMNNPVPIIVPEKYRKFIKVKNLVIDDDGTWYYTPQGIEMREIGSLIGFSNTLKGAIENIKEVADNIKGFDIKVNIDGFDEGLAEIKKLKDAGINFL